MTLSTTVLFLCLVNGLLLQRCMAAYNPVRQYEGMTFFDGWAFYGNVDNTTWGNVTYQDRANATSKGLAYVNNAGNAIIKVDNTTTLVKNQDVVNRDSIRLTSLDSYGLGSLIIMDALHIPYGCSVWPSFWTYGMEDEWPKAGEIDIIEAINGMDHNQVALHTLPGCFKGDTLPQSGNTAETDCSKDQGCIVLESQPNSFGPGFSQAGGGVYATLIEATGIQIWFFSRPDVPDNIKSASATSPIDVGSWGPPTGAYPSNQCNITQFFPPQNLVLVTTLCGTWAGNPSIYSTTCPGNCFENQILGSGSNYADAYWEVQYVRAYQNDNIPTPSSTASTPTQSNVVVTVTNVVVPQTTVEVSPNAASTNSRTHLGSLFLSLLLCLFFFH